MYIKICRDNGSQNQERVKNAFTRNSGEVHLNEYISSLNRSAKQSKTIDDKFEKYKRIFTSEYII